MLVRVDSQQCSNLATVHVAAVFCSRLWASMVSRASTAIALVVNPPRRTRSRRPVMVVTWQWKYQVP
jgi:hypothetical protein